MRFVLIWAYYATTRVTSTSTTSIITTTTTTATTTTTTSVNVAAFTRIIECLELLIASVIYLSSSSEETVGVVSCSSTRHVRR